MTRKPIKFLDSKRVYLRPIEEEDLDFFYEKALWDQESRRLTGTQAFFSRAGVQKWYEEMATDKTRIDLLLCLQVDHSVIGDLAMMDMDHLNRKAVVRIAIFDSDALGKGYGSEALSLLIQYGFQQLNLNRIGLDVFEFNERAIRAYKKLGFVEEGRIRDDLFYDGTYHDSICMGIKKEEFRICH